MPEVRDDAVVWLSHSIGKTSDVQWFVVQPYGDRTLEVLLDRLRNEGRTVVPIYDIRPYEGEVKAERSEFNGDSYDPLAIAKVALRELGREFEHVARNAVEAALKAYGDRRR